MSPSLAGTTQLTSHDRKMISVESLFGTFMPGATQEDRPAQASQRETGVEDHERREDQRTD